MFAQLSSAKLRLRIFSKWKFRPNFIYRKYITYNNIDDALSPNGIHLIKYIIGNGEDRYYPIFGIQPNSQVQQIFFK